MKKWVPTLTVSLLAIVGISGCGDKKDSNNAKMPTATTVSAKKSADKDSDDKKATVGNKLSAYTKAMNRMIGITSPVARQQHRIASDLGRYLALNIPEAKTTASIAFPESISMLNGAAEYIEKGLAIEAGGIEDVDQKAKVFAENARQLAKQLADLKPYYDSRSYKEDNFAKGRAAHNELVQSYKNTIAAMDTFDSALKKARRVAAEQRVEVLKTEGKLVQYNLELAFLQAQDLLTVFENNNNPAKVNLAAADEVARKLMDTVTHLTTALDAVPEQDKSGRNSMYYSSAKTVADKLGKMVGKYRDFKDSKDVRKLNDMLYAYNSAIEAYNRNAR